MHKSYIEKAKKICQAELKMREYVFRNDSIKRKKKVADIQYVISVLKECEKLLPKEQKSLYG